MTTHDTPWRPSRRAILKTGAAAVGAALAAPAIAAEYGPGASDASIKIGNINPYSGPASAYGQVGQVIAAYWDMINAQGGVNGRKIDFISYDDGYSPAKTFEQAQRLVEADEVLCIFQSLGTPTNSAIHDYMNAVGVPQLFVAAGASKWGRPDTHPWTMGWQPDYQSEARIYARHMIETAPDAAIGVLYQNDDYGKDYLAGLKDGLGENVDRIVAEEPYEVTDATIDSQMLRLKASGATVFFNVTTSKFAAQAIRKAAELDWRPAHYLNNVSTSVGSVLKPAGFENAVGLITTAYHKDPTDPAWRDDPAMQDWRAFMDQYYPNGDKSSTFTVYGYSTAMTLEAVLKQCGDTLTRANLMAQAANLKDLAIPTLLPGVLVNTSPTDFYPIQDMQLQRFNGESWIRFGDVLSGA